MRITDADGVLKDDVFENMSEKYADAEYPEEEELYE
jgi:hypothetical protein